MKPTCGRRFFPLATVLLGLGIVGFHGAPAQAGLAVASPIGDLTVTVRERTDGGVDFALSGSTTCKTGSSFSWTPVQYSPLIPPLSDPSDNFESIQLPPGLQFLRDETPVPVQRLALTSGHWYLQVDNSTSSGNVDDDLSGIGSIALPGVPYSHFVPGTFIVEGSDFDITYRVLPLPNPRLQVRATRDFAPTRVGTSSRPLGVRVVSVGDSPVTGIRVRLVGSGARQFRVTQVGTRNLAPLQRTTYSATFRPRSPGRHRAVARITSNAPTVRTRLSGRATSQLLGFVPIRPS